MLRKFIGLSLVGGLLAGEIACGGPKNVKSQDVTEKTLKNGDTQITTISFCKDGSKHTGTKTKGSTLKEVVEEVDILQFNFDWGKEGESGEEFILHHNNEKPEAPEGYYQVKTEWLNKGMWGYFSNYYSVHGGVKSFGFNRSFDKTEVCLENMSLTKVSTETNEEVKLMIDSDIASNPAHEEGYYQLCPNGENCFDQADAQKFRSASTLGIKPNKKACRNNLGLFVNEKMLNHLGIPIPETSTGPKKPKECKRLDGECIQPILKVIGGEKIKLGGSAFILGDDDKVDKSKYHMVGPKDLKHGFWQYYREWYERQGKIRSVGTPPDGQDISSICLSPKGEGFRIKNFLQNGDQNKEAFAKKIKFSEDDNCDVYRFCHDDECYGDKKNFIDSFKNAESVPDFSQDKEACDGQWNFYVDARLYKLVTSTWKEEDWEDNDWSLIGPTKPPPTTEPPIDPKELEHCTDEKATVFKKQIDLNLNLADLKIKIPNLKLDIENIKNLINIRKKENENNNNSGNGLTDAEKDQKLKDQAEKIQNLKELIALKKKTNADNLRDIETEIIVTETRISLFPDTITKYKELLTKKTTLEVKLTTIGSQIEECKTKRTLYDETCNNEEKEIEEADKKFRAACDAIPDIHYNHEKPSCQCAKYMRDAQTTSWWGAKGICESMGMKLVEIRDLYEREFMHLYVLTQPKNNHYYYWLNSKFELPAGQEFPTREDFKWSNGEVVDKYLREPVIDNSFVESVVGGGGYDLEYSEYFKYRSIWNDNEPIMAHHYEDGENVWDDTLIVRDNFSGPKMERQIIADSYRKYYMYYASHQSHGFQVLLDSDIDKRYLRDNNLNWESNQVVCEIRNEIGCDKVHTYRDRPIYVRRDDNTAGHLEEKARGDMKHFKNDGARPPIANWNRDYANCGYNDYYGFPKVADRRDDKTEYRFDIKVQPWLENRFEKHAKIRDARKASGEKYLKTLSKQDKKEQQENYDKVIAEQSEENSYGHKPIRKCATKPNCVAYRRFDVNNLHSYESAKGICESNGMKVMEIRDLFEKECVDERESYWTHEGKGHKFGYWIGESLRLSTLPDGQILPERSDFKWRGGEKLNYDHYMKMPELNNLDTKWSRFNELGREGVGMDPPPSDSIHGYNSIWAGDHDREPYDTTEFRYKHKMEPADMVYVSYTEGNGFETQYRFPSGRQHYHNTKKYFPKIESKGVFCEVRNEAACAGGYRDRVLYYSEYPSGPHSNTMTLINTKHTQWGREFANCGYDDEWKWPKYSDDGASEINPQHWDIGLHKDYFEHYYPNEVTDDRRWKLDYRKALGF